MLPERPSGFQGGATIWVGTNINCLKQQMKIVLKQVKELNPTTHYHINIAHATLHVTTVW